MISSRGVHCLYVVDVQLGQFCSLRDICVLAVTNKQFCAIAKGCHGYITNVSFKESMNDACMQKLVDLCSRLTSVSFVNCSELTDTGLTTLSYHCPLLTHVILDVSRNVTDAGVQSLALHCPRLIHISLTACGMTDVGLVALANHCSLLTQVTLDESKNVTDIGVQSLALHCPLLTHISVAECNMTDVGLVALANHCPRLLDIDFSGMYSGLTNHGLQQVALHCHQLTTLNVHDCEYVTNLGVEALASASCHLQRISVGCTGVGMGGLQAVAFFCGARLISINMDYCEINNDGLRLLATHCPHLTDIGIAYVEAITDDGPIALGRNCKELTSVDMTACSITGVALEALVTQCHRLTYVCVDACHYFRADETRLSFVDRYPHLRKCLIDHFSSHSMFD